MVRVPTRPASDGHVVLIQPAPQFYIIVGFHQSVPISPPDARKRLLTDDVTSDEVEGTLLWGTLKLYVDSQSLSKQQESSRIGRLQRRPVIASFRVKIALKNLLFHCCCSCLPLIKCLVTEKYCDRVRRYRHRSSR